MAVFIIVAAVIIGLVLELVISRRGADKITAEISSDTNFAEPGETVKFRLRIKNESYGLYPFVRYTIYFNKSAEIRSSHRTLEYQANNTVVTGSVVLLPKKGIEEVIEVSYPERGNYRMGTFFIESGDFLGMKEYKKNVPAFISTAVYPKPAGDPDLPETLGGIMGDFSVRRYIFEDPVLISGFREYSGRDPQKSISWLQSARTGRLMVKKYDYTSEMSVSVVLNTEGAERDAAERCFSIARSVCESLEKTGLEYDFFLNADVGGINYGRHYFAKGQGTRHLFGILGSLAAAEYTCSMTGAEMIKRLGETGHSTPGIIMIMPKRNEETEALVCELLKDPAVSAHVIYAKEEES